MCVRILTMFVIVNNVTTFEYKHVPSFKNPEIVLILSLYRCIKFETYSCKIWRIYNTRITSDDLKTVNLRSDNSNVSILNLIRRKILFWGVLLQPQNKLSNCDKVNIESIKSDNYSCLKICQVIALTCSMNLSVINKH